MYCIKDNVENTITIKKSKFITKLYKVNNVDEINNILEYVKTTYKDSTHICFAYILDNKEKCFDDKEPNKTAGEPILNVLKKNELNHILAIVIRYFGGIKLGVGGLLRAYKNSVVEALRLTQQVKLIEGYLIELEFKYENVKLIDYILNNKNIIDKIYENNITYKFYLTNDELKIIPELEKVATHLSIKDKTLVQKD